MTISLRKGAAAASLTALAVAVPVLSQTGAAAETQRAPQAAAAAPVLDLLKSMAVREVDNGKAAPLGPNPALVQGADPVDLNLGGWRRHQSAQAEQARRTRAAGEPGRAAASPITVTERESTRGGNDGFDAAETVARFGTAGGRSQSATLTGRLDSATVAPEAIVDIEPTAGDDATPETARDTGVADARPGIRTTGTIGGEPPAADGTPQQDIDFYRVTLQAGQLLTVSLQRTSGNLEPFSVVVDSAGRMLAQSRDTSTDAKLTFQTRTAGTYLVAATGNTLYESETDPGTPTTGDYRLQITAAAGDRDTYAVQLRPGDVLGASVGGEAAYVSVFEPDGTEVNGSAVPATGAYPENSPLPTGGTADTDHVARRAGLHYVQVSTGAGPYEARLEVRRYAGNGSPAAQNIFLDTDGATVDLSRFEVEGERTLSPLSAFLPGFGLQPTDEKALTSCISTTVAENLRADLRRKGVPGIDNVKVVTTEEEAAKLPGVSRLILGGTIEESGIPTVGIASSIDPGNFGRDDFALVLLDLMSGPAEPGNKFSVATNTWLGEGSDRLAFVCQAVANITSHEAGHFLGNWHVDQTNDKADLMDAGGNPALIFGVGPDAIGGTADDTDVDFGADTLNPFEGRAGIESTVTRTTYGMAG